MIDGCILCAEGVDHHHTEESLVAENKKLHAEIERLNGIKARAGADLAAANLQISELKEKLKYAECDANTQGIGIEQECDAKLEARAERDAALRLNGELRDSLAEIVNALRMRDHENRYSEEIEDAQMLLTRTERPNRAECKTCNMPMADCEKTTSPCCAHCYHDYAEKRKCLAKRPSGPECCTLDAGHDGDHEEGTFIWARA